MLKYVSCQLRLGLPQSRRFFGSVVNETKPEHEKKENPIPRFLGRVVASYGVLCRVQALNTDSPDLRRKPEDDVMCTIKGKAEKIRPFVGDYVIWERKPFQEDGHAQIMEILTRKNLFQRAEPSGAPHPLAANVDQTVIVVAPEPQFTTYTIDRFLVGAHGCNSSPAIIFNKADLPQFRDQVMELSEFYKSLGYPVVLASAKSLSGLEELASILANVSTTYSLPPIVDDNTVLNFPSSGTSSHRLQPPTSVFIGQSGTGKSSLLNALIPGLDLQVRELSVKLLRGKHTTTAATLHQVPSGGLIIDSPGFDNFFPVPGRRLEIGEAFIEFAKLAKDCKFSDCVHRAEPECAVKAALEKGQIRQSRYNSYLRLLGAMDKFAKLPRLTRPSRHVRQKMVKYKYDLSHEKDQTADLFDHSQDETMKEYYDNLTGIRLKKYKADKLPFEEDVVKMNLNKTRSPTKKKFEPSTQPPTDSIKKSHTPTRKTSAKKA